MALGHLPALDGFNLRGRNIDRDVAAGRRRRQGLQPLEICLKLGEAHGRRNVHHVDGGAVDDAGRRQRVTRLKLAHGLGHGLIVLVGDALPDEVAADLKTPVQDLDGLAGRAGTHGVGRHRRPAAIRHDGLVMRDRGLGRFDVARRQRRRAERRIGDPLTRRGGAFLGRKLIAMKGT